MAKRYKARFIALFAIFAIMAGGCASSAQSGAVGSGEYNQASIGEDALRGRIGE